MKYCAYCGASLVDSAASFCSECGKALKPSANPKPNTLMGDIALSARSTHKAGEHKLKRVPAVINRRQAKTAPNSHSKKSFYSWPARFCFDMKRSRKKQSGSQVKPKPDPRNEGYDGYYDDVKPIDKGQVRDQTDPELIKRILFVATGAVAVIMLTVIMMYLL